MDYSNSDFNFELETLGSWGGPGNKTNFDVP